MSERYRDYKGSSRSTRDDSRRVESHGRERTRSRSPRRRSPSEYKPESRRNRDNFDDKRKRSPSNRECIVEAPAPPPPPRISKISIGFSKPQAPIKMTLGGSSKPKAVAAPKPTVASVFNNDDDDEEPEEMPAEARMRMRNIGRETPTSAGPNSFGKTKQGFCDAKKVFEKNLKYALETAQKPDHHKLPKTIYKLQGP
ncbi:unnamed protein product [Pieris macdunnoughi]|uniref:PEST proteolytic signal-containing nuclear protein n=1 Tax=Pieris macdunnoughi TaxID=345717 RepID=A0A821WK47_9NEOP|nr:unnamed protein product [Pieris macdunnoughi]